MTQTQKDTEALLCTYGDCQELQTSDGEYCEKHYPKSYREAQLEKVTTEYSEYPAKVKIIKPDSETKWLDITENMKKQTNEILTKALKDERGLNPRMQMTDAQINDLVADTCEDLTNNK